MNMLASIGGKDEILRQARKCRAMGSDFVASVLEAVDRQLEHAPTCSAMVIGWPGDPAAAALALRINGALHALARRGTPQCLSELFSGEHDDFDGAIAATLSQEDQFIAGWICRPTQTNEVARAGAVMSALMTAHSQWKMPFQILELGSSCGLNLNLDRYAFKLGSVAAGDPESAVRIEPEWRGADPAAARVSIVASRGVDLNPLDASDAAHHERLLSFVWADQPTRTARLEAALQIAMAHPPRVDRGDAVGWLSERLVEPQVPGQCRAVVHSMFMQYLPDGDRQRLAHMIAAAGAKATADRPLILVSFEWTAQRRDVELRLTSWPCGETIVLAKCHPYGEWLEWCAPPLT